MKNILLFVCILICFAGCKKKSDTVDSSGIHVFKGIVVTDETGNALGTWGTEDGDWVNDATWTASEKELLNFPDTVSLEGTYINDTTGWDTLKGIHEKPRNLVAAYPNPFSSESVLVFGNYGNLKLKVVIVDKKYNRLETICQKWSGLMEKMMDFSDSTKYPEGIYRVYYSFSAKDSLNFYKGHGDILICRDQTNWQSCKNMVP
jgi:hypothetical protein